MGLSQLAVPSVYALIVFLGYSSQILLLYLEPSLESRTELVPFNVLLICLLITYTKSVFVDPGRVPADYTPEQKLEKSSGQQNQTRKWCRKCNVAKPPRAHHCSTCKRCIPKLDHHCPWTANCVSHTTFPHFMRFLFYAVISMLYLWSYLWPPVSYLWANRHLPSYLGPNMFQLACLMLLCVGNSLTLFVLSILLVRNIWCLAVNTTTIEGWEIERHKTLVRRARYFGGYLEGPDGVQMRIQKQEFPFDIGIWSNFKQGMGTGNILAWFWPFAATPPITTGLKFETNGFEDENTAWPPPDPDRWHRKLPKGMEREDYAFTYRDAGLNTEDTVAAFKKRQEEDIVRRRKPFVQRVEARVVQQERGAGHQGDWDESDGVEDSPRGSQSGEEAWRNSEGERLKDFGLDEEAEFYDEEDNLPLSELIARKRAGVGTAGATATS
ncbi:DHHC zinc finger membrane protein [Lophiostoma macrostomum CBS 122681]|uniref:Palmitoyltransferase PFA4 n=1 Tax=Lophiostoma macrostomum CBS 122681 TaxID=1314788 RepID=A0A6A6TS59_9PLEO|nr:DHHC zinc finger membrane protein [Lophiostoma macrostomum CBS 122681]